MAEPALEIESGPNGHYWRVTGDVDLIGVLSGFAQSRSQAEAQGEAALEQARALLAGGAVRAPSGHAVQEPMRPSTDQVRVSPHFVTWSTPDRHYWRLTLMDPATGALIVRAGDASSATQAHDQARAEAAALGVQLDEPEDVEPEEAKPTEASEQPEEETWL